TEHAKRRPVTWLRLHDLLLFKRSPAEGGICSCLVFHHPRQQAFAKAAAQNDSVVGPKRIGAQRHQRPLCRRWLAFRQPALTPGTAGTRDCDAISAEERCE